MPHRATARNIREKDCPYPGANPTIDRVGGCIDIDSDLQPTETESSSDDATPRPRGRRKKYRRWIVLVVLLGGLVWLNGPGLRWLAPKVERHYFQKAGLRGSFSLEGSLTGGIWVRELQIESDKTLARLTLKRAIPAYQLKELIKGRI